MSSLVTEPEDPRIGELSPARRELLRRKLAELRGPAAPSPPPRPSRPDPIPLSYAQRRLWFLSKLDPDKAIYSLSGAHRLPEPCDEAALGRALAELARRHESLRTTFPERDGEPVQVIAERPDPALPAVDLGRLGEARSRREARRLAGGEASRLFDPTRGPLLRTTVLRLAGGGRILLLCLHHLVSDGWSMRVLVRELAAVYRAFAAGRPSPLAELDYQYADFVLDQHRRLAGHAMARDREYWKARLAAIPPLLELPSDRPRPALQSLRGGRQPFVLAAAQTGDLKALARRRTSTLFAILLAAFDVLLYRHSGQRDLVVGVPVSNRDRPETEGLIGLFVDTLVLRAALTGDLSFTELLSRVREVILEAHAHRDLPFEQLVDELEPERSLSRTPLFQVMFAFQNIPVEAGEDPSFAALPWSVERVDTPFDLTLNLDETPRRVAGVFEYSADLFDATRIRRLAGQLRTLLEAVVADPGRRLSELPLLAPAERQQILVEWNDTGADPSVRRPVHLLFEERLASFEETSAVVFADGARGERVLTYRELNERANRLAHHLRRLGVTPDGRVAICLRRSPEMAVAVLATLKAGGACVPLDPAYPAERLRFMLDDAGAKVLVTDETSRERLPVGAARRVLFAPAAPSLAAEPRHDPTPVTDPDHLFYVIYTSGSTGRPKGVALPHRAITNLLDWHLRTHLGGVRTLQFASLSFDVSFYEMLACWLSGGCLVMIPETWRRDVEALGRFLAAARVEKAIFPVVVLEQLSQLATDPCHRTSLADVISTGEQLRVSETLRDFFGRLGEARLHNHYGPSESHAVTAHALAVDTARWPSHPPIGRPVDHTRIHLFDPRLRPAPPGTNGELYIGGPQLARGYLHRPSLSAERFLPDPHGPHPGERLYQSGDLARRLADGVIEYQGRLDDQVKVRGFRVEPAEVEAVLDEHPGVRESLVLARPDQAGDARLVAYVVAAGTALEVGTLAAFLARRLPDYMVPSSFVSLEAMPLNANGKVDRRALPVPRDGRTALARAFVAPRDRLEELVAATWSSVLGVEPVGAHDNFFLLGGHSLLATRVIARLRDRCGVELELRDLFATPTVAGLARRVERSAAAGGSPAPPIRRRAARGRGLPLSFAQERLWFLDELDPGGAAYNLPLVLSLEGPVPPGALAASLTEIVRRHEPLRTTFVLAGEEPVQRVGDPRPVELPRADLSALGARGEAELGRLGRREVRRPFDLASGPLLRALLVRLAGAEHAVFVTLHHIAADGWSIEVLLRELAALFDAAVHGRPSPLPDLPIRYADFALWQREWLRGEVLEKQLAFWRRYLGEESSALELPADRPRPPVRTTRGARRWRRLPEPLAGRVRELATAEGSTLFMTLLATLSLYLHRLAGKRRIAVGTPVANRGATEVEDLIGVFVNTLVLRAEVGGAESFRRLLGRVRQATLEAHAHQDLPFEKLVEELDPRRDLDHTPLFQVMFQLHTAWPRNRLWKRRSVDLDAAKFDLTVAVEEGPGREPGADPIGAADLTVAAEYNADLFDATTMERLLRHFSILLAAAAEDPGRPLAGLSLLTAAEAQQLGREWNDTEPPAAAPPAPTLPRLFAAQAARTPERTAVVCEDRRASFLELDRRSLRLAGRLRDLGIGPEQPVGILLERSLELIVALLGTLRAGAAYVPLDPDYPRERLAFMLEDARAGLVLTRRGLADLVPAARTLSVDGGGRPSGAECVAARPGNLAYVLYTSGSTGRPKGVAIEHRAAAALVSWAAATFSPRELGGVLASTSICFDLSVFEIFVPLSRGGCVVLAPSALHLPSLAAAGEVRLVNTVPSAMSELVAGGCLPAGVKTVNLAGEPLRRDLAEAIYATGTVERLYNLYGPSEDTTYSTWARVERGESGPPSIGRPLAASRARVLGAGLAPLPAGAPGELCLAGAGLARGYFRRARLTAERFVPDPFAARRCRRLYRTGDRARRRRDGQLEFLGRFDHQVKIRGFRVEPGEIEAVLRRSPEVAEAAVVPAADRAHLVAYVVARRRGAPPEGTALRSFLRTGLPEHMVPSAFVVLESLPLTANGKVDRAALGARALSAGDRGGDRSAAYEAPRSETERLVAGIWRDVLGLERVGLYENFFDLGGHSLLLVRAFHRLRASFEPPLESPLTQAFEHPTVGALAKALERERSRGPSPAPGRPEARARGEDRGSRRRQVRRGPRRPRGTR